MPLTSREAQIAELQGRRPVADQGRPGEGGEAGEVEQYIQLVGADLLEALTIRAAMEVVEVIGRASKWLVSASWIGLML